MIGQIASLHIHGMKKSGDEMKSVQTLTLVANKGIMEDPRYYDKTNKQTGFRNRNHVSIIERDQICDLMQDMYEKEERTNQTLETKETPTTNLHLFPGRIRSNIEYQGISDIFLIQCGRNTCIKIGKTAVIQIYKPRTTCYQMDNIHPGLQDLTKCKKLGVIGEVLVSGEIKVGDPIVFIDL
jgi:hypothetical protein